MEIKSSVSNGSRIREQAPRVIFAVGAKAAWLAQRELPDIPLVYTMVQNPERFGLRNENNIEVQMHPPKDLAVSQLQLFFPDIKHMAVFSSDNPTDEIQEYIQVMKEFGIETTLLQSSNTNSLRKTLNKLPSHIDGIWLPTDPTWLTPETFYHINNTGIKNAIPILSNSTYLAQAGALLSISSTMNPSVNSPQTSLPKSSTVRLSKVSPKTTSHKKCTSRSIGIHKNPLSWN